jgi:hypothetical protein
VRRLPFVSVLPAVLVGLVAVPGVAVAAPPTHQTQHEESSFVAAECDGFEARADMSIDQRLLQRANGDVVLHVHLTGTVGNSVTGRSGTIAEVQVDIRRSLGERSAGLLTRLTVPGRGTALLFAGTVRTLADGAVQFTPHLTGLDDEEAPVRAICTALG